MKKGGVGGGRRKKEGRKEGVETRPCKQRVSTGCRGKRGGKVEERVVKERDEGEGRISFFLFLFFSIS